MNNYFAKINFIFFIFFFSVPLASCHSHNIDFDYDQDVKVLYEKKYDINSGKKLNISTENGDVKVNSHNKNEVIIKITGTEAVNEKLYFKFEASNDEVAVTAKKKEKNNRLNNLHLKYEILVPSSFATNIKTSGGDIHISNIKGTSTSATSGGDIHLNNLQGSITAATSGGDIVTEKIKGDCKLATSGGDIEVQAIGNINATTSGGNVKVAGADGEIKATTSGGDVAVRYKGVNKGITAITSGGNVDLYLPSNLDGNLKLSTSGGDIDCDLSLSVTNKGKHKLEGRLGNGGEEIKGSTSGGNVSVEVL